MFFVPLPPLRGQHTVLCHRSWQTTFGLTEFAICWGGARFEPGTTDLQSGVLPLSHLSSLRMKKKTMKNCFAIITEVSRRSPLLNIEVSQNLPLHLFTVGQPSCAVSYNSGKSFFLLNMFIVF